MTDEQIRNKVLKVELTLTQVRLISVSFGSESGGFVKLRAKGDELAFSAKGVIPSDIFNLGAFYDMTGFWCTEGGSPIFRFNRIKPTLPSQEDYVIRFLTHKGFIQGMTNILAQTIVDTLGGDALEKIKADPSCLKDIKGVGKVLIRRIPDSIRKFESATEIYNTLFSMGVSPDGILDLYQEYGIQTVPNILNNPYQLSQDHSDVIPFVVADRISLNSHFESISRTGDGTIRMDDTAMEALYFESRIRAGIFEALRRGKDDGHSFMYEGPLVQKAVCLLAVNPIIIPGGSPDPDRDRLEEAVSVVLQNMKETTDVICIPDDVNTDHIYLPSLRQAEENVCERLFEISQAELPDGVDASIEYVGGHVLGGVTYSFEQMEAITSAMTNMFMVITGGPGTGKTTIMADIVRRHLDAGRKIALAAPTAKAADRMKSVTGLPASTIQRLIGDRPGLSPLRTTTSPISADVVIVDEFSMVDVELMSKLVNAIAPGTFFLAIGDADQLPSVGPGNVFGDIIQSGAFVVRRLSRIFRQKNMSSIPEMAAGILRGTLPENNTRDIEIHWCQPEELVPMAMERIRQVAGDYRENLENIRVLTPLRISAAGSKSFSEALKPIFNPVEDMLLPEDNGKQRKDVMVGQNFVDFGKLGTFRVGDRVMQGENNYQLGVMNGEEGQVCDIDQSDISFIVRYDSDRLVKYTMDSVREGQLELSYAITVHKSQGSEYPDVFLLIPPESGSMMNRRLIYTAVTRARGRVFIYGSRQAMMKGLVKVDDVNRNSGLLTLFCDKAAETRQAAQAANAGQGFYNVSVDGMIIPLFSSFGPAPVKPSAPVSPLLEEGMLPF